MEKTVINLLENTEVLQIQGPQETKADALAYDSRTVREGTLFFALEGVHTDGHKFIAQAIKQGASAVVHSRDLDYYNPKILYVKVPNTRKALSPMASAFYDHPSRELKVIGITGTDGKSTTVSLVHQLLELAGHKAGLISTVQFQTGSVMEKNALRQSTPEAAEIHKFLRDMRDNGKDYAVVESTSHGLSLKNSRLEDVDYDAAIFTNVTREHLEFHGSLEQYRADKSRLFHFLDKSTNPDSFGVVNGDDPHNGLFRQATTRPTYTFSLKDPQADLYAFNLKEDPSGTEATFQWKGQEQSVRFNIPQSFNIENLMGALIAVSGLLEQSPMDLIPLVPQLKAVKGRMCPIQEGQPFHVIVDYAHTPGSFKRVLPDVKKNTPGRLILVFGSGGERDLEKRPIQGQLAAEHADILVLADEDPRLEDPMKILKDIQAGCPHLKEGEEIFLIPHRVEAFKKAFSLAKAGDTVLLLGKGHEGSIIQADGSHPWDEIQKAREVLASLGFTP